MAKFEAHITCNRADAQRVAQIGKGEGWSYSAFDADPIMGDKPYSYLTAYSKDQFDLLARMQSTCARLEYDGVHVLRSKIERIVYDTKTNFNELAEAA